MRSSGSGSAGCQPARLGSLPRQAATPRTFKIDALLRCCRQAAGNCRLAACAPQDKIAPCRKSKSRRSLRARTGRLHQISLANLRKRSGLGAAAFGRAQSNFSIAPSIRFTNMAMRRFFWRGGTARSSAGSWRATIRSITRSIKPMSVASGCSSRSTTRRSRARCLPRRRSGFGQRAGTRSWGRSIIRRITSAACSSTAFSFRLRF